MKRCNGATNRSPGRANKAYILREGSIEQFYTFLILDLYPELKMAKDLVWIRPPTFDSLPD